MAAKGKTSSGRSAGGVREHVWTVRAAVPDGERIFQVTAAAMERDGNWVTLWDAYGVPVFAGQAFAAERQRPSSALVRLGGTLGSLPPYKVRKLEELLNEALIPAGVTVTLVMPGVSEEAPAPEPPPAAGLELPARDRM